VKLFVKDDGLNPAQSLQDAKALVTQDHIQAIVGGISLVDAAWASYIQSAGIPVIGGASPETTYTTYPDFFPAGSEAPVEAAGAIALLHSNGAHKIGSGYCAESPICAAQLPPANAMAAQLGMKTNAVKILGTAPSYVSPCLELKGQGDDGLFLPISNVVGIRFLDACAQQGYKVPAAFESGGQSSASLKDPNEAGSIASSSNANPYDTSLPAIAQFQAALDKYAPGALLANGSSLLYAWVGGKLFEAAAKAGNIGPNSTPADIKKALYALHNETLDGLAPPLNFTPGKTAVIPCYFAVAIKSGKFTSLNNNKPYCLSASQLAAVSKAK
jgi:branched-chain amino acid transport system substrate-binding protein